MAKKSAEKKKPKASRTERICTISAVLVDLVPPDGDPLEFCYDVEAALRVAVPEYRLKLVGVGESGS